MAEEKKRKQETEGRNEEINQPFEWKNRTAEEMNERIKQHPEWEIITSVYHLPELTEEEKREVEEQRKKLAALTDEEWLDLVYPNRKRDKEKEEEERADALKLWEEYTDEEIRRWLETGESLPER